MSIYDIVMHFYRMLNILVTQGCFITALLGANLVTLLLILRKLRKG